MSKSMRSEDIGKRYEGDLNLTNISASNVDKAATSATLSDGELNLTTADGSAALNLSSYADSNTDNASDGTKGRFETSAYSIAKSINSNEDINVNAEATNEQTSVNAKLSSVGTTSASGTGGITTATATATYSLSINGVAITAGYTTTATATNTSTSADDTITADATVNLTSADREHIVDAINNKSDETDVTAKTVSTDSGDTEIELNSLKGGNMAVDENITAATSGNNDTTGFFQDSTGTVDSFRGNVEVQAESVITADDTGADQEFTSNIGANGTAMFGSQNDGLASMDVSSVTSAQNAIEKIDAAINDVDSFRATMGAAQNRMESTIANLENSVQNLTEARSRIKDADIAKEAAEQTMNNVRRQASASVLTQANQSPQLALQLLGG
jgi:flagellin